MSQVKTVDYLDLKITVQDRLHPDIEQGLKAFDEGFDHIVHTPKFSKSRLRINSMDLIHFLGFLQMEDWLPLDKKRFFHSLEEQLNQLLLKSLNADYQYHYKWCLSALKNLQHGRYLETGSER